MKWLATMPLSTEDASKKLGGQPWSPVTTPAMSSYLYSSTRISIARYSDDEKSLDTHRAPIGNGQRLVQCCHAGRKPLLDFSTSLTYVFLYLRFLVLCVRESPIATALCFSQRSASSTVAIRSPGRTWLASIIVEEGWAAGAKQRQGAP